MEGLSQIGGKVMSQEKRLDLIQRMHEINHLRIENDRKLLKLTRQLEREPFNNWIKRKMKKIQEEDKELEDEGKRILDRLLAS
jgi:hypothetical protein